MARVARHRGARRQRQLEDRRRLVDHLDGLDVGGLVAAVVLGDPRPRDRLLSRAGPRRRVDGELHVDVGVARIGRGEVGGRQRVAALDDRILR